ncbi:DNA methylase [Rugosibacter aromaticivorans]|uniref:DNA methylase n=1 Tax=Rugosibacter aromaticivorans TaxID=1565605 RepID=A0A0C5J8A1_9PROT|nr:DNA methyltransferase [Rugosibacter aromaticivorans]AJP47973.1 DNA methylase [Rugosibacter aromaticivorans]
MNDLLHNQKGTAATPVECLGQTFPSDQARREHFLNLLREKLKDPEFRKIEGFPVGTDEDILALSDPPYYTACPNPFLEDFVRLYGKPYDPSVPYNTEPFVADVSEGKNDPIYNAHSYHTKVPHKAIMRYIDHYTKPGDLVFDGFCGTGMSGVATARLGDSLDKRLNRKCVLVDLSPIATFIARNLNGSLDSIGFLESAKQIVADVALAQPGLYATNHTGWKVRDRKSVPHRHYGHPSNVRGEVEFVLYSDVVACPNCGAQHPFYAIAVDEIEDSLRSEIKCPTCGVVAREAEWDACFETNVDPLLNEPHKQARTVPVLINYSVGTSRYEKIPDEDDLATIASALQVVQSVGFPIAKLIPGKETQRNVPRGITHLHHFFTPRELLCVALLLKRISAISDARVRHPLLFALTACLPYASRMRRFRADRKGGGPLSGTLYVGSLITPPNVLNSFLRNAETIASSLAYQRTCNRENFISTQSATALPNIPDGCIDYIFVDPPFGKNFDYSELNFFWEAVLRVVTRQGAEAIVSTSQEKELDDYRGLLTSSFKEFFRILKPGRWMTVEFSNTQAAVWNAIQTALQEAGFVVANVSALDKKQGSFKAVTTTTAVKQDLIISAYKPNGGLEDRFTKAGGSEDSAWDFVRTHLKYLPTVKGKGGGLEFIAERDPRIIFDRMVAWFVRHNFPVPMSTQEFQAGLKQRFPDRDGMVFLSEQVTEYDKKRMQVTQAPQMEMFISDERSAIDWLTDFLKRRPSTYQEIHPEFISQLGAGWKKHEAKPELAALLEDNFIQYDGTGDVPSQIHSLLSTNFKDLRGLEKNDPRLMTKAKDRWYVPDPNKAQDLEKKREKALLKEFDSYRAFTGRKLKEFRLEAMRAGFKAAWGNKDYKTIIAIAQKLPEDTLQEDEKLLLWYDQALTRSEVGA